MLLLRLWSPSSCSSTPTFCQLPERTEFLEKQGGKREDPLAAAVWRIGAQSLCWRRRYWGQTAVGWHAIRYLYFHINISIWSTVWPDLTWPHYILLTLWLRLFTWDFAMRSLRSYCREWRWRLSKMCLNTNWYQKGPHIAKSDQKKIEVEEFVNKV